MEKQNSDGMTDHLMNHYLGGRDFGAILSAGTVYASLFSGYTVVGIVNGACIGHRHPRIKHRP
jgi:Na+/proline symporter